MISFMSDTTFLLIILGTMIVTYIPRMLPLVVLSKTTLPPKVERFLDNIPIAILGSILCTTLIEQDGNINISFDNEYLIVGLITIVFARFVKRVDLIVLLGIVLTMLYRSLS